MNECVKAKDAEQQLKPLAGVKDRLITSKRGPE